MKSLRTVLPTCAIGVLLLAATAVAQDADKAKLIEIEKAFVANPDPGPPDPNRARRDQNSRRPRP